jgi:hypothetical protein
MKEIYRLQSNSYLITFKDADRKGRHLKCYTIEDLKPPLAVPSSMATLPINELKRTHRVRI